MITREDVMSVAFWAMASASVTMGLCWAGPATAVDGLEVKMALPRSEMKVKNCTLHLRLAGKEVEVENATTKIQIKPGMLPEVELVASNSGAEAVSIPWRVGTMLQSRPDFRSRVPAMPQETWNQEGELSLQAGETVKIKLNPKGELVALMTATLYLECGGQRINALTLQGRAAEVSEAK